MTIAKLKPFLHSLLHIWTKQIDCEDNPALTTVHRSYSESAKQPLYTKPKREKKRVGEVVTSENILRLKMLVKSLFDDLKIFNLFKLKFPMHLHIVEDVSSLGALNVLDASLFEQFN